MLGLRSTVGENRVARVRLKGINTVQKRLANGTIGTYYYHRATGRRLVGQLGSPEFIASYAEAEKAVIDRLAGTFNGLIRDYTLSLEFQKNLAPSTQVEYRRMLRAAETEFGDLPIAALDDSRVRKEFLDWRENIAHNRVNAKQTIDFLLFLQCSLGLSIGGGYLQII